MITNSITKDSLEWKYYLEINSIWKDWDFYFDITDIIPFFDGFMVFSESIKGGENLSAKSYEFATYRELADYVRSLDHKEKYLNCILKHKTENKYCLRYSFV